MVPATELFRDRDVFAVLAAAVVPDLLRRLGRGPLRAWAVGVATGEEAWSLAMLLAAACADRGVDFDLVASDLDATALDTAQQGRFRAAACEAVPQDLRARFLADDGGGMVRVADELRAHVHFAEHDLMGRTVAPREAVIASFHVIALRNVLIYFDRRLQGKAVERLRGVLEPGGALVLGLAETLPDAVGADFAPYPGVPSRLRIFTRRSGS
jgi:chemotaxis methyl-accepting protein methylase